MESHRRNPIETVNFNFPIPIVSKKGNGIITNQLAPGEHRIDQEDEETESIFISDELRSTTQLNKLTKFRTRSSIRIDHSNGHTMTQLGVPLCHRY